MADVKVAIVGSCVTRDAFAMFESGFDITFYCMHTCIPSIMARPAPQPDELTGGELSPFFQRNIVRDFDKTLFEELRDANFDILICDFVEERYDLFRYRGTLISDSYALSVSRAAAQIRQESEHVVRAELRPDAFRDDVVAYAARLAEIAGERPLVLNHVRLATTYVHNDRLLRFPAGNVDPVNARLTAYAHAFLEGAPTARVIDTTTCGFRGDYAHRWKCEPFHYETAYYRQVMDELLRLVLPGMPTRVMSPYERWWPPHAESLSIDFARTYAQFSAGDFAACAAEAAARAETRPLTAEECHYYGRALYDLDLEPLKSAQLLALAVGHDGAESAWTRVFLAFTQIRIGRFSEAKRNLELALDADHQGAYGVMGHVKVALRQIAEAAVAEPALRDTALAALAHFEAM